MSALEYYDPRRQDDPGEHEDCVVENGERWFGHGMECRRPELHVEHQITAEQLARIMAEVYEPDLRWDEPADYDLLDRTELTESAQKILNQLAHAGYRVDPRQ